MVLSNAVADSPDFVAPGITLNQFGAPGLDKLPGQVGVLQELGLTNLVHNVELCRLPVGAETHPAAKPLGVRGRESAELLHPPGALCSLKGGLVVLKLDALVVDRSGVEVAQEGVLIPELSDSFHGFCFSFQMVLDRYMQSERIPFFDLAREDLGGWAATCGPPGIEGGRCSSCVGQKGHQTDWARLSCCQIKIPLAVHPAVWYAADSCFCVIKFLEFA